MVSGSARVQETCPQQMESHLGTSHCTSQWQEPKGPLFQGCPCGVWDHSITECTVLGEMDAEPSMFQIVSCHLRVMHLQLTVQSDLRARRREGCVTGTTRAPVSHHWLILSARSE